MNKSNSISYPVEKREEKKRYKLRKIEEQEAEEEISLFYIEEEEVPLEPLPYKGVNK